MNFVFSRKKMATANPQVTQLQGELEKMKTVSHNLNINIKAKNKTNS